MTQYIGEIRIPVVIEAESMIRASHILRAKGMQTAGWIDYQDYTGKEGVWRAPVEDYPVFTTVRREK